MADRIIFAVSATPVETLTTENNTSWDIIASEVNVILGGNGESVNLDGYEDVASSQGYSDGAVYYQQAAVVSGGTVVISNIPRDFIFIKNTGHKYSTSSELGLATTDCVLIVMELPEYSGGAQDGWTTGGGDKKHYYELAWLKPGQAIILPAGASSVGLSQFGANTNDLSALCSSSQYGSGRILARTFTSIGGVAVSSNAVEFLAVD
jgi:hypothetical protein